METLTVFVQVSSICKAAERHQWSESFTWSVFNGDRNSPEIEGLSINVRLREQGSDIVKAALHYGKMQSWRDDKQKTKTCKNQNNIVTHDLMTHEQNQNI